ncbi:MAG: heavy metal translocating P-type ATPase [Clostridia bacterium]|nr:heavy metal translocating P-type ATPase [Clostridia bacterium]
MEQYNVTGMSCAACSARVEKAVSGVEGVTSCTVSLLTNSMGVEGTAPPEKIIAAVKNAGYGASLKNAKTTDKGGDSLQDTETPALLKRFVSSLAFLLILMYFSMGHMMFGWPLPPFFAENHVAMGLLQLMLTAIVMVINQKFFISGFKGLIHRAPNMDTLVSLGATAAFGYSAVALFLMTGAQVSGGSEAAAAYMDEFYFESAAMILTLITLGKMLEARSKGKTTNALKALIKLAPKTAAVERDGTEITIPAEDVRAGDIFVVRAGESIPVDGEVTEGFGAVNEASLTGESIPVDKTAGSSVSAGTINLSGFMRCRATRVGEDTTLSQIIKTVSDAAATKAPIAKIADKVSGVFVPAVIAVALVTIAVWLIIGRPIGYSLARGISVLVISCPCALGLATPVAIMVANGVGAKNGILFKTAASIEITGKARIVALDKTGTVTSGKPAVTDVLPAEGFTENELISLALSLEKKSEHPLAKAVVAEAERRGIISAEAENFTAVSGGGLKGTVNGMEVYGGNYAFVCGQNALPSGVEKNAETLANAGKTPLFFSAGEKFAGVIAVADVIKEDAAQAVKELKGMGARVVMLTGDNERTAAAIGKSAGIDEVIAGVLPSGKEQVIIELKKQGKVIMVGDGINDAPALTQADVGVAIGAGTDVAIDAADVVLMKNRLKDVPAALRLSRAALRIIRQNLFWAFIYNALLIPLAAGVFSVALGWAMDPMYGAAAMSLSSFCVVTNALRLNLVKINDPSRDRKIKDKTAKKAVKKEVSMEKTLVVEGMMCAHCEARVKKALEGVTGVSSAAADHVKGIATVTLSAPVADEVLKSAVEAQDYTVKEIK